MATDDESWKEVENNPHCMEIVQNTPHMHYSIDPPFFRILRDDAPQMPYTRTTGMEKTRLHWGQRKLLMSEIEFLTIVGREELRDGLIVYAGAAPGNHVIYLHELFPEASFLLVDPAPFNRELVRLRLPNVEFVHDIFTDELAVRIARREAGRRAIYFISDIRTADPEQIRDGVRISRAEVEMKVREDQANQMRWHELVGSRRSMLKFRLPWDVSTPDTPDVDYTPITEYLDGDIFLPVWGPVCTSECRLITKKDRPLRRKEYDNKKYESQMMYFNNVTRHSLYPHNVTGEGLDHCYDCAAEIRILKRYQRTFHDIARWTALGQVVSEMSSRISRVLCGEHRNLTDPNPDPEERLRGIRRTQQPDGRAAYERAHQRWRGHRGMNEPLGEDEDISLLPTCTCLVKQGPQPPHASCLDTNYLVYRFLSR